MPVPLQSIAVAILKFDPGQPRDPKGSATGGQFAKASSGGFDPAKFDPAHKETWYERRDAWHRGPNGENPYGWTHPSENYAPPEITHKLLRGRGAGIGGGSHSGSSIVTGESAQQMGIEGWKQYDATTEASNLATRMLEEIAKDTTGSEEPLYHSFQNVQQTVFRPGDTMKLPLMASAGKPENGDATRLEAEGQEGAPTVFAFPKGTPMVAYGRLQPKDLEDVGAATLHEAFQEQGYIWNEAVVAGQFRVVKTEIVYIGSQHTDHPTPMAETPQLYGQVVHLEPIGVYDPVTKTWRSRG